MANLVTYVKSCWYISKFLSITRPIETNWNIVSRHGHDFTDARKFNVACVFVNNFGYGMLLNNKANRTAKVMRVILIAPC